MKNINSYYYEREENSTKGVMFTFAYSNSFHYKIEVKQK